MWWRLGILGGVTATLLFVLLAPMATVRVKVDLPPVAPSVPPGEVHTVSPEQAHIVALSAIWITELIIVTAILAIAVSIARRIVRRHRI